MTGQQVVNYVAPAGAVVSQSQFHTISWVEVQLSPNPTDRDVYKQGSQGYGDNRVQLYALTGTALAKLMNAAGISEVHSHRTDDARHPYIVSWQFKGKWVQPDSTEIEYSADYTCDLRDWITIPSENGEESQKVRGARFEKAFIEDRDTLIKKAFPKEDWKHIYGDVEQKRILELLTGMPKEDRDVLEEAAESFALRRIVQSRLFITQLAQTGAMDRVVRKFLSLKSTYTGEELSHPFSVPRSRFDWDRMDAVLGKQQSGELKMISAMKMLGISASELSQLKQISAPAPQIVTEAPMFPNLESQPEPQDLGEPELPNMPAPVNVAEELGGEQSDTFECFSAGLLDYRRWKKSGKVEISIMGFFRDAKAEIKSDLSPENKEELKRLFPGKEGKANPFEIAGHLKKHFKKATIGAMTWEEFAAMLKHKNNEGDDSRWYPIDKSVHIVDAYEITDVSTEDAVAFLEDLGTLDDPFCLLKTMQDHKLTWEKDSERLRSLASVLANKVVEFGSDDFESLAATGEVF